MRYAGKLTDTLILVNVDPLERIYGVFCFMLSRYCCHGAAIAGMITRSLLLLSWCGYDMWA